MKKLQASYRTEVCPHLFIPKSPVP
uniref:Uncharacterized protein n=1 Tax=Anguilla anguilla TaxID=7936 RepID=A0A0E9R331_ANGAN